MLLRAGELWMLEKPDEKVKQDYFRLFRVGLKSQFKPDAAPGWPRIGEIEGYPIASEAYPLLYT